MLGRRWMKDRLISHYYYKVWWLDVLYPLLLAFLIFSGLTYLFYTGQKHRRISAKIEDRLIHLSLWLANPRPVKNHHLIATVSLREEDLPFHESFRYGEYTDASPATYQLLIDKLLDLGAETIFINWQPQPEKSEGYAGLIPVLGKARRLSRDVLWGVHPKFIKDLPPEFQQEALVLEADPCQMSTQILCVYNENWTHWIMQAIPIFLWKKKAENWGRRLVISDNLPRLFPSYILYYNDPKEIQDYSFHEILTRQETLSVKTIFVGNLLIQGRKGMSQAADVGRVQTILDESSLPPRTGGTPLHTFWAQHAQLFLDDDLVAIIPYHLSFLIACIVALLTIMILFLWGPLPSLGFFLAFASLAPLVNTLMLNLYRIYLPIFDSLYAGISASFLATFAKLSAESFYHWRLRIRQRSDKDVIDAKGNFISLLSHNLNTPIAKMQGMLSAIEHLAPSPTILKDLHQAQTLVATIQLSVRFVLVTTFLEDKNLNPEACCLVALEREFREMMENPLVRLGFRFTLQTVEDDLSQVPLRFDKRALTSGLAACITLLAEDDQQKLTVELATIEEKEDLVLSFQFLGPSIGPKKIDEKMKQGETLNLLAHVSATLIHSLLKVYRGRFEPHPQGITLFLKPSAHSLQIP